MATKHFGRVVFLALFLSVTQANTVFAAGDPGLQALLSSAERDGSVRVIAILSVEPSQPQGAMPIENYISELQTRTLQSLGWVNINDLVRFDYSPAMALRVDPAQLRQLSASPTVSRIVPDRPHHAVASYGTGLIGAPVAHQAGAGGSGQVVAILDTGVDSSHPLLAGKVAGEACFSSSGAVEGTTLTTACPNGRDNQTGVGAGRPCDLAEECKHGTHVAGIIAGKGPDYAGVAPEAKILAVQVFRRADDGRGNRDSVALTSDIVRGLEWVYHQREKYRIASINMSLGGGSFGSACDGDGDSEPLVEIFRLLRAAGIAPVVASGNESKKNALASPACLSSAVSVGAIDRNDQVASFSNSAGFLTLLAPGVEIPSSVPGGGLENLSGTSMAAPHVAGAIASLRSAAPDLPIDQLIAALRKTGKPDVDLANGLSVPRIQLDLALAAVQVAPIAAQLPTTPTPAAPPVAADKPKPPPAKKSCTANDILREAAGC